MRCRINIVANVDVLWKGCPGETIPAFPDATVMALLRVLLGF